jgi:hypothetical protein
MDVISRQTSILIDRFRHLGADSFDLEQELYLQKDIITGRSLNDEEKLEIKRRVLSAIHYQQAYDTVRLIPVSMVSDPRLHEEWYEEWLSTNKNNVGMYYWKRLEDYLSKALTDKYGPEKAGKIVKAIDVATNDILGKLANPLRTEFSYKGLVVGYVQSGKTANFTALIAKAVDAGYKFIVVLAGIHDILRRQTQLRLDKELTGINDLHLEESFVEEPSESKRWYRLTTYYTDFAPASRDPFVSLCERSTPTLAVIKKNCTVLKKLIHYIRRSNDDARHKMPLLIIDDEADQASIDTKYLRDVEPSRTNDRIRTLLKLFPRKAYVGYTATPFANVLIDMKTEHERLEDDLYPRNFIVSLPRPDNYFGSSVIFSGELSDLFVNGIPDEKVDLISSGQITDNLAAAIDEFILCCSVRNLRGDRDKPMSMLVHISHKIHDMGIVRENVQKYCSVLTTKLSDSSGRSKLSNEYSILWNKLREECNTINSGLGIINILPDFRDIWNQIPGVLNCLKIVELNIKSEDVLDYSSNPGIKVIAIGGNQLSRGLTLEGLMTSYYLRKSGQYDTLLQMGRWFGYRAKYEDLTRIYTTADIWDFFEHLALVEDEIRTEIYRYEEERKTPSELAIAIKAHDKMKVTAPNKIGAGTVRQSSYSESLNQTTWFHLDKPEILRSNKDLGDQFVRALYEKYGFDYKNGVFLCKKKIEGDFVLENFLRKYKFVEKDYQFGAGLDANGLLAYISRRLNDHELQSWSIAVAGIEEPADYEEPVAFGGLTLNMIHRSRKYTPEGFNIGVLTDKIHLQIDLPDSAQDPHDGRNVQNPLLLLYLISKESKARKLLDLEDLSFGLRIDLYRFVNSEKIDVLGLAMVLPKSRLETFDYIGQKI